DSASEPTSSRRTQGSREARTTGADGRSSSRLLMLDLLCRASIRGTLCQNPSPLLRVRRLVGGAVVALLLGAGGVTGTHAAATSTASLVPTDDGYVSSSQPTKTFGSGRNLEVDASPVQRSYLKFDLSSINGTVTRAVLRLTATSSSSAGFGVRKVA